jgi:hypothetical protein
LAAPEAEVEAVLAPHLAVVAERPLLVRAHLEAVAQPLLLLFLQFPARLLKEAQHLRPVPLPAVVAVLPAPLPQPEVVVVAELVQGLVASETLRNRSPFSASTARSSPSVVQPTCGQAASSRSSPKGRT